MRAALRTVCCTVLLLGLAGCGARATAPVGPFIPPKVSQRPIYVVELDSGVAGLAQRFVSLCADLHVVGIPLKPLRLGPLQDARRNQVPAEDLIDEMERGYPVLASTAGTFLFGITSADMFPRERPQWPFAHAWHAQGRFVVISVAHIDPARMGLPPDPVRFASRFRKIVYRNLGGTFFQLHPPKGSHGLMRNPLPDLDALDALPDAFTAEDLPPAAP